MRYLANTLSIRLLNFQSLVNVFPRYLWTLCLCIPAYWTVLAQPAHKNIAKDTAFFEQSGQTYQIQYSVKKLNYRYEIKAIPEVSVHNNKILLTTMLGLSGDTGWVSRKGDRVIVWDPRKDNVNSFKGIRVSLDTAIVRRAKLPRFWGLALHGSNSAPFGLKVIRFGQVGFFAGFRGLRFPPDYRYTIASSGYMDYKESGIYEINYENRLTGYAVTGGPVFQIARNIYAYAGVGYGVEQLYWQYQEYNLNRELIGSSWALNEAIDHKGTCIDLGAIFRLGRFFIDIGASTIQFESYQALGGIGISF